MRRFLIKCVLCLAVLLFSAWPCSAQEIIKEFDCFVQINEDSTVCVTENIDIAVDGSEISHGIKRRIPVVMQTRDGRRFAARFEVLSAAVDGVQADYETERSENCIEIKLGSANYIIQPGLHRFTIKYSMSHTIGFFDGYDELYWNVTGTEWSWSIEHASCTVKLPEKYSGEKFRSVEWYVGAYGAKGSKGDARLSGSDRVSLTRELMPREGLTVVYTWQKGLISEPASPFAKDIPMTAIAFAVLAAALAWAFFSIMQLKRKANNIPSVIPRFYAPDGTSPAYVRHVYKRKCDNVSMASDVVSMAIKGALTITEREESQFIFGKKKIFVLEKKERPANLTSDEANIFDNLFETANIIEMTKDFSDEIARAIKSMKASISVLMHGRTEKSYFHKMVSVCIFAAGLALMFVVGGENYEDICAVTAVLGVIAVFVSFMISAVPESTKSKAGAIALAMAVPVFGTFIIYSADEEVRTLLMTVPMLFASACPALIKPFTQRFSDAAAKEYSEVCGLNLYITVAEKSRIEMFNPPEETPQLYERLLPYAIALDAAKTWGDRFASVLADVNYNPDWYYGRTPFFIFANNFYGNEFAHAVASSMPASESGRAFSPGSSSGFGGGGFSGGGAGGGGGSGW